MDELRASFDRAVSALPGDLQRCASDATSFRDTDGKWHLNDSRGKSLESAAPAPKQVTRYGPRESSLKLLSEVADATIEGFALDRKCLRALSARLAAVEAVVVAAGLAKAGGAPAADKHQVRVRWIDGDWRQTKRLPLTLTGVTKRLSAAGKRTITGLASTPAVDLQGDVVDPLGGTWTLPCPLLWSHKHDQPIGWVRSLDASRDGIRIVAELAEGISQADEVWKMLEAQLATGFSVGFTSSESEPIPTGRRFTKWRLHEVSVVVIPAAPSARIDPVGA